MSFFKFPSLVTHGYFHYHKDCYVCHICHKMTENLDLEKKLLYCKNCYETCSNCDAHIKRDSYIGPASGMVYCKKCRDLKQKKKCLKCHEKIQEVCKIFYVFHFITLTLGKCK